MKKVVYILTALLTVAVYVFLVLETIDYINREYGSFLNPFSEAFFWIVTASYIIDTAIALAYGILSLIQLRKSTPRLILIFSGYAFFNSFGFVYPFRWWGLLYLAAGLLPAFYELIKYGRLVKIEPCKWQRYGGLLIAAGVASCLCIANSIYSVISNIPIYTKMHLDFFYYVYFPCTVSFIHIIFIIIFCFLRYRRTGVLYRMFLIGSPALGVLFIPGEFVFNLFSPAATYSTTWTPIGSILSLALVVLILTHAFKTRHDGLVPQEHMDITPQTEIPVS